MVRIDIEGEEFDFLNSSVLMALSQSTIVVELHPFLANDGNAACTAFRKRADKHFSYREVRTGSRNLQEFTILDDFSDNEIWLIASEGRKMAMRWAVLEPLK